MKRMSQLKVLTILSLIVSGSPGLHGDELGRREFALRMASVGKGMSSDTVRQLLGQPDNIMRVGPDHGLTDATVAWQYGLAEDGQFPSRGEVLFVESGDAFVVSATCGGAPVSQALATMNEGHTMNEGKLRLLLEAIDQVSECDGASYDPSYTMRAANALIPLGKDNALAVLHEYVRVLPEHDLHAPDKIALLLRVLFDTVNEEPFLESRLGAYRSISYREPRKYPKYPILVVEGVPFLIASGYSYEGVVVSASERLHEDFVFCRDNCAMRSQRVMPTSGPTAIMAGLSKQTGVKLTAPGERPRSALLLSQVLCLCGPARPATDSERLELAVKLTQRSELQEFVKMLRGLDLVWDEEEQRFVRKK